MKACCGTDVYLHVFLISAVGVGEFHASAALCPVREPSYPSNSRLGVPQSRCGRFGEERNFFRSEWNYRASVFQSVALPLTEAVPTITSMWRISVQSCLPVLTESFMLFARVYPVEYLESRHAPT